MATKNSLQELFDDYGYDVSETMIERCADLCSSFSVDPREYVDMLVAFSINQGVELTESILDDFERKELANNKSNKIKTESKIQRNIDLEFDENDSDGDGDDVMGAYICTTPKTKKPNRSRIVNTPVTSLKSTGPIESPISVPLKDITGKVVYTFGTAQLIKSINWTNTGKQTVKFERISESYPVNQNYMYDNLLQKTSIAADRIFDIGDEICNKLIKDHADVYGKDLHNNVFKIGAPTQAAFHCVGRICSDSDCQLDLHSTWLIGADEICLRSYRLHFDRMKSFALFPGQTVLMQGVNPRGDSFFVDEIISERDLTYANPPQLQQNLNIIVASGPFTTQENMIYEPLNELLAYCKQHRPDVLILIGPFLDADHPLVQDCSMKITTESYFETMLSDIIDSIGTDTEVFIVSSSQDVHSTAVYPTAPYAQSSPNKNVTFLPDPSIIKLNGITIGMTATDIYNHILDAEIAVNAGDKVKRVANHLFNQATFYPLNPPSDKVSIDSGLAQQFATLPIVPNILILRSSAKCFAREVKPANNERGCFVLNPGSMCDNNSAHGTFSRLIITPSSDDATALNSIIGCQIIKV